MDYTSIAERIDVEPAVVRLWRSRNKLPEPDFMIAQSPGWLPATIEEWTTTFVDGKPPARKRS